ncbi:MAG: hypothetical protein ND895_17150 [Pyrinomonadaceae bacterium]|nr:hypothetical protein [Pyrinomonadaceae bacterium]
MHAKAIILPLDSEGTIYSLQDEKGNTIGTGTRDVCEALLKIITRPSTPTVSIRSVSLGSHTGRTTILVPQRRFVRLR